MHRRHLHRTAQVLIAAVLLLSALVSLPDPATAASTGSGTWYWPVGTENFRGWDGWWVYRPGNRSWHMAQDMPVPTGSRVYAIGDGTVLESKADAGYGGVLVILHQTGDGRSFKAVYGHMKRASGTSIGSKVKAGQVIGWVNSCRHLHFGIHPGRAYPSDNNPFRGHTYVRSNTYGWTDPVAYLRAHPRTISYKAPSLPEIAQVETSETPTVLGVAGDRAFWSIGTGVQSLLFSRSVTGTDTAEIAAADLPILDIASFPSIVTTSGFALYDARPSAALVATTKAPSWRYPALLTGRLTNAAGVAFVGARLTVETSLDGETWSRLTTATTSLSGQYTVAFVPSRRVLVRARFAPPALYRPVASGIVTVAPRPSVTVPAVPAWIVSGHSFAARGMVVPRHTAGTAGPLLRLQRRVSGVWVDETTAVTTYRDVTGGSSYSATLRLTAGTWRVRAEASQDDRHASRTTSWRSFTVR